MEDKVTETHFVKHGKMKKAPWSMTPEETKKWKEGMVRDIRSYLFSIGQPLVYRRGGKMIAEYPDGKIEHV